MSIKSAVGVAVRHESVYIQEWCCFYYLQGFDKIIICIHDIPEDTRHDFTEEKIMKLPPEVLEKVIVIHTEASPNWGFQFKAYHFIREQCLDCDWLAMFDADEYLYDVRHKPINEILATLPDDAGQIIVPWMEFGHSNRVFSATPEETRLAVFNKRLPRLYTRPEFKSIIKVANVVLDPKENNPSNAWYNCHFARTRGRIVNLRGEYIVDADWHFETQEKWREDFYRVIANVDCWDQCLAHYFTGSMEDWINRNKRTFPHPNPYVRDVKKFLEYTYDHEDDRMSIYVDNLRELLKRTQN